MRTYSSTAVRVGCLLFVGTLVLGACDEQSDNGTPGAKGGPVSLGKPATVIKREAPKLRVDISAFLSAGCTAERYEVKGQTSHYHDCSKAKALAGFDCELASIGVEHALGGLEPKLQIVPCQGKQGRDFVVVGGIQRVGISS